MTTFLISIIYGLVNFFRCYMSSQRFIHPFITQGSDAHGEILETPLVDFILGECVRLPSFILYKFP